MKSSGIYLNIFYVFAQIFWISSYLSASLREDPLGVLPNTIWEGVNWAQIAHPDMRLFGQIRKGLEKAA